MQKRVDKIVYSFCVIMQEMGFEQNPKSATPHRKELSGVLTWVCKQSVNIYIIKMLKKIIISFFYSSIPPPLLASTSNKKSSNSLISMYISSLVIVFI